MVDEVLELLETDEHYRFTLDGQLATVDDYLEIRPENEGRLRALVEAGRLAIGPWQTLVDEFLVSGETIVRNLEIGLARAAEFGPAMRVGYLPDSFGHVAQMPQILQLAGIERALVWRGVPAAVDGHSFSWESPDGSAVRAEYLPDGYGNAAHAFEGPGDALAALEEKYRPWFGSDPVLGMVGTDHMAPARNLPAEADIGTLADYLATPQQPVTRTWRGELRSGARANLLPGCVSARIDLKAACGRAERWLERYAEPLGALYGEEDAAPFLREAWKLVIQNAAHDSICGCSADEVSAQVLVRYAEAEQIARELAHRAVARIAREAPRGSVVIVNPSPFERIDLVELDLAVPAEWDAVALETPGNGRLATQEVRREDSLLWEGPLEEIEAVRRRIHGRELFGRVLNGYRINGRVLTLEVGNEPDPEWLDVEQLVHEIELAIAGGDWTLRIEAQSRRVLLAAVPAPALGWSSVRPVRTDRNQVTQCYLEDVARLTRIVRGRDVGDSYNYAPPGDDVLVDRPDDQRLEEVESGPLRTLRTLHRTYSWDEYVVETATRFEQRQGEPFVRVRISFDNPCVDQRVRVHVPLREHADHSYAEGQFAVVERGREPEGGYGEVAIPTFPAGGFVAAGGIALLLDHVSEYELLDDELALTMLRSTGLISRAANRYRADPAGPEVPIPAAQLHGPRSFTFGYSTDPAAVLAHAERYAHPFLTASGTGRADAGLGGKGGPKLTGDGAVLASLRRRDGRLEARVVNETPDAVVATFGNARSELGPWKIQVVTP